MQTPRRWPPATAHAEKNIIGNPRNQRGSKYDKQNIRGTVFFFQQRPHHEDQHDIPYKMRPVCMTKNMANHPYICKRAEQRRMVNAKNSVVRPSPCQPVQYQSSKTYHSKPQNNRGINENLIFPEEFLILYSILIPADRKSPVTVALS